MDFYFYQSFAYQIVDALFLILYCNVKLTQHKIYFRNVTKLFLIKYREFWQNVHTYKHTECPMLINDIFQTNLWIF